MIVNITYYRLKSTTTKTITIMIIIPINKKCNTTNLVNGKDQFKKQPYRLTIITTQVTII
jgi:hypothetical protein